jgi:hypothetical protein
MGVIGNSLALKGIRGHRAQGVGVLTHGALPQHLPGKEKVEFPAVDQFAGDAEHQGMAVYAGVEIAAVAVAGIFQHCQVDFADVPDDQWNVDLPCGDPGALGAEERGNKNDTGDGRSLAFEGQCRQAAVETSGKKSQCFTHHFPPKNLINLLCKRGKYHGDVWRFKGDPPVKPTLSCTRWLPPKRQ